MGTWVQTCHLSNLPIKYNEKIVVIPLLSVKDISIKGITFDVNDKYAPFCMPIIGTYNDYGGIENIENESEILSIIKRNSIFIERDSHFINIDIYNVEDFFDIILEENIYIKLFHTFVKMNYMIMHYDIYNDFISEISKRKVNNSCYRDIMAKKINDLIKENKTTNLQKMKFFSKKIFHNIIEKFEKLEPSLFEKLTYYQKEKMVIDLSSDMCRIGLYNDYLKAFAYEEMLDLLKDNFDDKLFNRLLDLLMFEKALQLSRNGYLVKTGLGHQGTEYKLPLIISTFVVNHIATQMKELAEKDYTEQEIHDSLMEDI